MSGDKKLQNDRKKTAIGEAPLTTDEVKPAYANPKKKKDTRFLGPLSYRHLRIIGWLCLFLAQVGVILQFKAHFAADMKDELVNISSVFKLIGELAVPLFLIANFAVILNGKRKYKELLLFYGGLSLVVCAAFFFVAEHYIVPLISASADASVNARESFARLMRVFSKNGFIEFNVFIDLFLCTALSFFATYRPTKFFRGKKLAIFRSFAILPVLYESASIFLKIYATTNDIALSPYFFPFLTTKPPMMFILFVDLVLFVKVRERRYIKKGNSPDGYGEYVTSNVNSWHFSIGLMLLMIAVAIVDMLLLFVLPFTIVGIQPAESFIESYTLSVFTVNSWGFGNSFLLILLAPFLLLFSYTKSYKKSNVDMFIPIIGIALMVFVYIEGLFQILMSSI